MSVDVTVVTTVEFSATLTAAVPVPPFEVTMGASLTRVIVTVVAARTVCSPPPPWSLTVTLKSVLNVPDGLVLSVGVNCALSRAVSAVAVVSPLTV